MAPIGGAFQLTDIRTVPRLPTRRLVAAGETIGLAFLWYEHGGRGYHQHFVLLATAGDSATASLVIRGLFGKKLDKLRAVIAQGKFDPETDVADKHQYW